MKRPEESEKEMFPFQKQVQCSFCSF